MVLTIPLREVGGEDVLLEAALSIRVLVVRMSSLLIYEHLCAAETEGGPGQESLLREGRSMLCALVEDFVAAGRDEVCTVWHRSWGRPLFENSVGVFVVDDYRSGLEAGLRHADGVILIAPESDGILEEVTAVAEASGCRLWGCSAEGVRLAGDKWRLFQEFSKRGIATISTELIDCEAWKAGIWRPGVFPCVLKPRWGAGSQETFVVRSAEEWGRLWPELREARMLADGICQPVVRGRSVSVGVWCDGERGVAVPLPMVSQRLSDDGRLKYQGGELPSPAPGRAECEALAARGCLEIAGLRGYVGVDLIVSVEDGEVTPVVVEINPRLTTSYVGYRRLVRGDLSICWERPEEARLLDWKSGQVQFDGEGNCKKVLRVEHEAG